MCWHSLEDSEQVVNTVGFNEHIFVALVAHHRRPKAVQDRDQQQLILRSKHVVTSWSSGRNKQSPNLCKLFGHPPQGRSAHAHTYL